MKAPRSDLLWILLLVGLTAAAYGTVLDHGFLTNWDDGKYVTSNPDAQGLSFENLHHAFTRYYVGHYAPTAMVSYMLDYELWGLRPQGFLLTNVLIHTLNGLLVFALVLRLGGGRLWAFLAGYIFLLDPVQVESVAWISQRKNLLSLLFFLVALLLFTRFSDRGWRRGRWAYLGSVGAFALALLAKAAAVILPVALVLYELCFQTRKWTSRRTLIYIPFVVAAIGASLLAVYSQSPEMGGGRATYAGGSLGTGMLTMLPVLMQYIRMLFWPANLSPLYFPRVRTELDAAVAMSLLLVVSLIGLGIWLLRRHRNLFFWYALFFLGLAPVSQVVPMVSLMNDRYLYFPMVGAAGFMGGVLAAGCHRLTALHGHRLGKRAAVLVAAAILLVLPVVTSARAGVWQSSISLWRDAVGKYPESAQTWYGLADALHSEGAFNDALGAYSRALTLQPDYAAASIGLAILFGEAGDLDASRRLLEDLVARHPDHLHGWIHLAHNRELAGDPEGSFLAYLEALRIDPDSERSLLGLVHLRRVVDRPGDPRTWYRQAHDLGITAATLEYDMACHEARSGNPTQALEHLSRAVQIGGLDTAAWRHEPDLESVRDDPEFRRLVIEEQSP